MPKSFASSRLLRRRRPASPFRALGVLALLALALLTAGCGGAKNVDYSPAAVQAAFAAAKIPLYGPHQVMPQELALEGDPAPSIRTVQPPLQKLLKGVRDTFLLPALRRHRGTTVLRGNSLIVYVFPRAEDAQQRVQSFADLFGAEEILHRVAFGYARKGNVVVSYGRLRYQPGVTGVDEHRQTVLVYNQDQVRQVKAALAHLR
jgi:hypothetical protein